MARGAMISTYKRKAATSKRRQAESKELPHTEAERIPDVVDFRATWDAYHLNKSLCEEQLPPQPKVKNCRHNPLCIHRLGLEKWDKLLKSKNQDFVKHEYTPRDPATQPCGLVNVGNSCYVNSFLQMCFNDLTLRQCVFDWRPDINFVKPEFTRMDIEAVMNSLQELFITLQITPYEDASAQKLVELLQLDNEQHDAIEFTMLFFDALDRNLEFHGNGASIQTVIRISYEGKTRETMSCTCGKIKSSEITILRSLSLPITGFKSLTQACEKYFRPELLTDYRCDMCGQLGTTTKVCEAVELPPTLMISLNRYQFNNQGQNKKVTSPLQFPKTLETRKFAPNLSGGHWQYELSAVMIHEGPNTDSGHYYDVIKDPVTGHWYTYNDKDVKEAKCPGVLVEKDAISRATPEMRGCYALIYRRIERDPALNIREPWLPPSSIVDPIRNRLSVEFSRDRNEGSQSVSLWTDVVKNRYKWISELWRQLEVADGNVALERPRDNVFIPTALLQEVQSVERKSVEVMKDVGDMEMDLTTHPRELYPIEPLPETHLQFCAHGKLSLKSVIAGDVKLVNRTAAITLLQKFNLGLKMSRKCFAQAESQEDCFEYYSDLESSDPVELCSGLDICIDCVKHFKHEGSFKDRLEKTCQLAQSICKNKFRSHDYQRVPCPPEYIPVPGAVWVAKNQLSSFKKLALKQMEYLKRLSGEENLQLNFTTNAAPYKVAPVKVEEEKTQEEKKPRDATPVTPVLSPKETLKVERGKLKKLSPVIDKAIRKSGEPAEDEFDITDGEASDTSGSDPEEKKRKFKAETEGTPNPFAGLVAFKNGAGFSRIVAKKNENNGSVPRDEDTESSGTVQNGNCTPSSDTIASDSKDITHRPSSSISSLSKTNGHGFDVALDDEGPDQPVHYNKNLLCTHGKLTYKITRAWVRKEEWEELTEGYFDLYNTVFCTEQECDLCVDEFFNDEAQQRKQADKIVQIFNAISPICRAVDRRKTVRESLGIDFTRAICSHFFANLKNAFKAKGKVPIPTICQRCILCTHERPYLAMDEEVFGGTARPIPITAEEWDQITSTMSEMAPETKGNIFEILLSEDGSCSNLCEDCADEKRQKDDMKRFEYTSADIYVKLKGDEPEESAAQVSSKIATTRRALAKNLIKIKMKSTDTIMNLKLQLYQKVKQTPADQLIYNGETLLDDNMTLAEARIDANNLEAPLTLIVQTEASPDTPRALERGFKDTALATFH